MKIVRHTAPDMRQALRAIREQLGEDAVILSSRRLPKGVEVTAAVDFDASKIDSRMDKSALLAAAAAAENAPAREPPGGSLAARGRRDRCAGGRCAARAFRAFARGTVGSP